MTYEDMLAKINEFGVHAALGPAGKGWGIEHNPHELATFLAALPSISSVLEIGTGYRAGLARFLADVVGWWVTSVDVKDYQHSSHEGLEFIVAPDRIEFDHQFDLVIIDADHHYESVEADYIHYGPRADKIVAFHDICGLRDCGGAARFWHELAYTKKGVLKKGYYEAIAEGDFRSGIGWVVK